MVEDCVPLDPGPSEVVCSPNMELQVTASCVDQEGTCGWEISEICVPKEGGGLPPSEDDGGDWPEPPTPDPTEDDGENPPPPPPPPSGTTPRDIAPRF